MSVGFTTFYAALVIVALLMGVLAIMDGGGKTKERTHMAKAPGQLKKSTKAVGKTKGADIRKFKGAKKAARGR